MPDRRCIFFITSHTFHHKPKAAGYVSNSFPWLCNSRRCSEYYDGFYFEKPSMGRRGFSCELADFVTNHNAREGLTFGEPKQSSGEVIKVRPSPLRICNRLQCERGVRACCKTSIWWRAASPHACFSQIRLPPGRFCFLFCGFTLSPGAHLNMPQGFHLSFGDT